MVRGLRGESLNAYIYRRRPPLDADVAIKTLLRICGGRGVNGHDL